MLIEELVDLRRGRPAADSDAFPPRAFDDGWIRPFAGCHRQNYRLDLPHLSLVEIGGVDASPHGPHSGNHAEHVAQRAHILEGLELLEQIVHVELVAAHPALKPRRLFDVDLFLRPFDEGLHVAHAEDARGHAVGVVVLQRRRAFAGTDELDRKAGGRFHRQRRAASRVAVHFGQYQTGEAYAVVELRAGAHRVLSGHRIDYQESLRGLDPVPHLGELVHHPLIEVKPARGVEDEPANARLVGRFHGVSRHVDW